MSTASRTIAVRLTLEEADQFRAALKSSGVDGEAALKKIADAAKNSGSELGKTTEAGKLAGYQLREIAEEAHKFADQVLAGGSALKAFAFQAPNAVAVAGGFKNALAAVTNLFTPFRAGALLAVGGITAMVVAAETVDARLTKLRNSLVGYTSDYAALASRINASSAQQAGQLGIARSDVQGVQTTVAQALPGLSDTDLQRSVQLARQFGLTLDQDIGGAMQRLGQLAKDPAATIKQLAEQGVPGLSASLVTQIDLMQRSGDRAGAYKQAMDALLGSLSGAKMTASQEAASKLRGEFERFWTSIENGLAGPGAAFEKWLADTLKGMNDFNAKTPMEQARVYGEAYEKAKAGGAYSPFGQAPSNVPAAQTFVDTYGSIITSRAAAAGVANPQLLVAQAAFESRYGTQLRGGANNPFNLTGDPNTQDTTAIFDRNTQRSYNMRNFASPEAGTDAYLSNLIRLHPGILTARTAAEFTVALGVAQQGGYAEGDQNLPQGDRPGAYATGIQSVLNRLYGVGGAGSGGYTAPAAPFNPSGRRRDIDGPAPNPPRYGSADYTKSVLGADGTLEARQAKARADISGTESDLAAAQAAGNTGDVAMLTAKLRDQRVALEALRDPVSKFIKDQNDQAASAKTASGAQGDVQKALADLDRVARDSGWAPTEAQKAQVVAATLERLSAGYTKAQTDIIRTNQVTLGQAHAWDTSTDAGRQLEAQQKAIADARQYYQAGTPAFTTAVQKGTQVYLDQASAAAALAAAQKLINDRHTEETLNAQIGLTARGAGPDEQARALADLQARQGLDGVTDTATRNAALASSSRIENLRLQYANIQANTNELGSFVSSSFDKIGSDVTSAITQGTDAWTAFGNVGKAVISEVLQEMIKLSVINPLKNALLGNDSSLATGTSVLAKLFGGGAGFQGSPAVPAALQTGGLYHVGGIAGFEPTSTRMLPASTWHGAPRYHTGGIADDEVPAVLKVGEGVFTAGQMKALGAGMGGGTAIQADFHYHAAAGGDGKVPSDEELARASKIWAREQKSNILAVMAGERRPGGILYR